MGQENMDRSRGGQGGEDVILFNTENLNGKRKTLGDSACKIAVISRGCASPATSGQLKEDWLS